MRLKFKSKESTSREKHQSAESLAKFMLNNKSFLGITLSILDEWKNNIDSSKIEDIVKNNFRFEESIIKDKNYKEFIKLLNSFYNGTEDELNGRRGRFLELIWDVVGTYNGKEFTQKIDEAIVLENEVKISEKDIDIVYIGEIKDKGIANFIEIIFWSFIKYFSDSENPSSVENILPLFISLAVLVKISKIISMYL